MFYKKFLKCHSGNTAVYCTEKKKPKMNNCKNDHSSLHITAYHCSYFSLYCKKTSFSNMLSDILQCHRTKISPAQLKRLSTATPFGSAALYFRNAWTKCGYCNSDDVLVIRLHKHACISWSMLCSNWVVVSFLAFCLTNPNRS